MVGEISQLGEQDLQGPPHRPPGLPPGGRAPHRGPVAADDVLRPAGPRIGAVERARGFSGGRRGIFMGKVGTVPRRLAADQPADGAVRHRRRGRDRALARPSRRSARSTRSTPLTKDVESWDLQKAISFARTVVDEVPELLPDGGPARVRRARRPAPPSTGSTRPTTWAQIKRGPAPLPVRGGAGHPAGARRGAARCADGRPAARRRRRRAARGVRRAAAVRAHRGPDARSAPRSSTTSPSRTR